MNNRDLVRYAAGVAPVPKEDKAVAKRAKGIYDEVRETAMEIQGRYAAGAVAADAIVSFHEHIKGTNTLDPLMGALLTNLEVGLAQESLRDIRGMFGGGMGR